MVNFFTGQKSIILPKAITSMMIILSSPDNRYLGNAHFFNCQ